MGTRSLTRVIRKWEDDFGDKRREPFTTMYRQMDGYLEGHGNDLAEFLSQFTIVNGMKLNETRKTANGIDCLAAQMFAHFKDGPGSIYCMHPSAQDCGEEYIYEIEKDGEDILMTVYDVWNSKEIFHGTPEKLLEETSVSS
tara:strand:+ start:1074 stop:1496 length:423 start_codon:yes stop_codon:yes gene_type:complete